jgi:hypothetical protein
VNLLESYLNLLDARYGASKSPAYLYFIFACICQLRFAH